MKNVERLSGGLIEFFNVCVHVRISFPIIRMVAEAAAGKSKHQQMQAEARVAAKLKREDMHRAGKKEGETGT